MRETMPDRAGADRLCGGTAAPGVSVSPRGRGLLGLAAAGGAGHAVLGWADGGLLVALLAAGTVAMAGGWRGLVPGHRGDLAGALGVVWLAVAVDSPVMWPAALAVGGLCVVAAVSTR